MDKVVLLAEQGPANDGGFPRENWGIRAASILMPLLIVMFSFGKGRRHF